MGTITAVVLAIVGVILACLSKILADEFKAWTPRFVEALIALAVKLAPRNYRDRLGEEWRAYVNDTPGDLGKLWSAFGLIWASARLPKGNATAPAPEDDWVEPTMEEILASIRRVIAEDEKKSTVQPSSTPFKFQEWPPVCKATKSGSHQVPAAAVYASRVYGNCMTFQGPCVRCGEWIDTGEMCDD